MASSKKSVENYDEPTMKNFDRPERKIQFSVVIPLFNKENDIARAMKSVLNQSLVEFELIIVDDGSTDKSFERTVQITDNRIKIIRQENAGVSAARNKGIEEAQSDYIAFLDADDELKPGFLMSIKGLIERFPDAGAYAVAYEFRNGHSTAIPFRHFSKFALDWEGVVSDYFLYTIETPLISASSVVVPKAVFTQVGMFPVGIARGEDLDMWSRIALKYDIVFKNTILSTYYLNADNRATQKTRVLEKSILKYAEEQLSVCLDDGKASASYKEYLIKRNIHLADHYYHAGERKKAIGILWKLRSTKLNKKLWWKTLIKITPLYPVAAKIRSLLLRSADEN